VAFSPEGNQLAVGLNNARAQVWNLGSRQQTIETSFMPDSGSSVFLDYVSVDNLVVGNRDFLYHWRLDQPLPESLRSIRRESQRAVEFGAFVLAPDRRSVCVSDFFGRISRMPLDLNDQQTPSWELATDNRIAFALAWSGDGSRLAAGQYDGVVNIYDATNGAVLQTLGQENAAQIGAIGLSPDGKTVVWAGGPRLHFWRNGETRYHSMGRTHFLGIAFHPSGDFFATAKGDGTIDTWDTRTGERRESFDFGLGKAWGVAFDPAGDRAAVCGKKGKIVIWDVDH
jgi:WD40 repeat protein